MSKNLRSLDLNLVPVLRALLVEQSVTRAAARIGLSQPAASNALRRLRDVLGDALLVKSGQAMVRMPFAEHLLPLLEVTCNELERLLHHEIWSPDTATRQFVIVMADYLVIAIAKDLQAILTAQAPNVTVRFGTIGTATQAELSSGKADIAYLGQSKVIARGVNVDVIRSSILQGIVPPSHPFATRPPSTLAAFLAVPRVGIDIPSHLLSHDETMMAHLFDSAHMPLAFSTNQLSTLPRLAMATGAMAVVPSIIAFQETKENGMTIVDIPERNCSYHLCQYWSNRFRTDPGHRWMREIVGGLIGALAPVDPNASPPSGS